MRRATYGIRVPTTPTHNVTCQDTCSALGETRVECLSLSKPPVFKPLQDRLRASGNVGLESDEEEDEESPLPELVLSRCRAYTEQLSQTGPESGPGLGDFQVKVIYVRGGPHQIQGTHLAATSAFAERVLLNEYGTDLIHLHGFHSPSPPTCHQRRPPYKGVATLDDYLAPASEHSGASNAAKDDNLHRRNPAIA